MPYGTVVVSEANVVKWPKKTKWSKKPKRSPKVKILSDSFERAIDFNDYILKMRGLPQKVAKHCNSFDSTC